MTPATHITDCGLPGIKDIPYGLHMCHFYEERADLAATLVPYFAAGLQKRERGIWVTAEPLDAAQAKAEARKAGLDIDAAVANGDLRIIDYSEWYAHAGSLKGEDVIAVWLEEEQRALAQGYQGLRITGNVTFVSPEEWPVFMDYEHALNEALLGSRIVTLCSYRHPDCSAAELLDVARRHDCTLDRPDAGWQIISTSEKYPRAAAPTR